MSAIQRKIVVFAIALTCWGNAHAERCTDRSPEYKNAGLAANNAFNNLVNFRMNHPSMNNTPYMNTYNESLYQFLQDGLKYCSANQTITTENFTDYLKVVEFSLSNVSVLTDLEKEGAFDCISDQKHNMDHCLEDHVDQNITLHNNYSLLHAKSHLAFSTLPCSRTENVKSCVLDLLKDDNKCDKANEYVKSLFDFVISTYCQKNTESNNATVKTTGHWSTFIIVSIWSALVLSRS